MNEIVTFFDNIARLYLPISHTDQKRRFCQLDELDALSKTQLDLKNFFLVLHVDQSEWVNRAETETELVPVHLFCTKSGKTNDFSFNREICDTARLHLAKIYGYMLEARRNNQGLKFDHSSKQFEYIQGEKGDQLYGAVLTVTIKMPIAYDYNPQEWLQP